MKAAVIGSGIGGLASALRLKSLGFKVDVFEKNPTPGGKLGQIQSNGYRFDTGPSLFTLPGYVDELFKLFPESKQPFSYRRLKLITRYFYEDKTVLNAYQDIKEFAKEAEIKTTTPRQKVLDFLKYSQALYNATSEVFIESSLSDPRNYFSKPFLKSYFKIPSLGVFKSMHKKIGSYFEDQRLRDLFSRYATYNGSNPFIAPSTLNVISHIEHGIGAYFPEKGMFSIVESLVKLATKQGVQFYYNSMVDEILTNGNKTEGIKVNNEVLKYDVVVADSDIYHVYDKLLPNKRAPRRIHNKELSTSAIIFYWGVSKEFPELDLHNILFSSDYKSEFDNLFNHKTISNDPTVYIFISKKQVTTDAPKGHENWFVMINTPPNDGQNWDKLIVEVKSNIVKKINRILSANIENYIDFEEVADPRTIESNTLSYKGALYGANSNNPISAFMRHPNFLNKMENLYFVGGSVHPGGGIPLCLSSAKIAANHIEKRLKRGKF